MKMKHNNRYHVYVDRTNDGRPFYVGKGNDVRVQNMVRNQMHANVAHKHGINRDIVFSTSDSQKALSEEITMINVLHTFIDDPEYNGIGCNLTPGGEGHVQRLEERLANSRRVKERWKDPNFRHRVIPLLTGNRTPRNDVWKAAHSNKMSGIGNPNFGKRMSNETRAKLSASMKGNVPWNKGKKLNECCYEWRFKTVIVTNANTGDVMKFRSHKAAAVWIADALGVSYHTPLAYLSCKKYKYRNLIFDYDCNK